ncbi:ribose-phosphate diphosphokinase [Myxococcota bacterium]|nr:ribose-phosphate diphosphokinase [Myxococcota bacterium]
MIPNLEAPPLLFTLTPYEPLGAELLALLGAEPGVLEVRAFPDGERYQRLITDVRGRSVIILAGTTSDTITLQLYDLACAISKYGADLLTLVIPYFGYSTMERAMMPGEVVTAKSRARLLSNIPAPSRGLRVVLLELHSAGIPHYFEGDVTTHHLDATPVLCAVARRLGGDHDFVIGSCDAGRAKRVVALANALGVEAAFIYKRRVDGSTTEIVGINANVLGREVIIYDDMIRSGGTLMGAARAYLSNGATGVSAIATHAVFAPGAFERLSSSGLFKHIVCTNSHPSAQGLPALGGEVISVAPLLAEGIWG